MVFVRLEKKELPLIIENIEKNGGDASQLRAIIEDGLGKYHPSDTLNGIVDDDYVEMMLQKSPVEVGTNLECMLCHSQVTTLISGVCSECFRIWVLSTKKG